MITIIVYRSCKKTWKKKHWVSYIIDQVQCTFGGFHYIKQGYTNSSRMSQIIGENGKKIIIPEIWDCLIFLIIKIINVVVTLLIRIWWYVSIW